MQLRGKASRDIPGYCFVMRSTCNVIFSEAVDSEADCQLDTGEADATCELFGGGPEDPLADACLAAFTGAIEIACKKAVDAGKSFGETQCDDAVGCGCKSDNVALGGACATGQDACCQDGAACGRYNSDDKSFLCCSSYQIVSGVAWCSNAEGGECSAGDDDNCQAGSVCGRYNGQSEVFQCCSSYNVSSDNVAWCTNSEGGECSDGENSNCVWPLACGAWADSTTGYACCSDYSTASGPATCNSV